MKYVWQGTFKLWFPFFFTYLVVCLFFIHFCDYKADMIIICIPFVCINYNLDHTIHSPFCFFINLFTWVLRRPDYSQDKCVHRRGSPATLTQDESSQRQQQQHGSVSVLWISQGKNFITLFNLWGGGFIKTLLTCFNSTCKHADKRTVSSRQAFTLNTWHQSYTNIHLLPLQVIFLQLKRKPFFTVFIKNILCI